MDNEKQLQAGENATQNQTGPDQTRRRLTGSALGVSAIFTLASSPVLAGGQCLKPSGFASGNLSTHGKTPPTCTGKPPEYWCQSSVRWPTYCRKSDGFHPKFPKNNCGTKFYNYSYSSGSYTVKSCQEVAQQNPAGDDLFDLGRYCLAACLSISENPSSIPCMTTGDINTMWYECTTKGSYEVTAGHNWTIKQCRDYIKTLCA